MAIALKINCSGIENIHNKTAREINFYLKMCRVRELSLRVLLLHKGDQHFSVVAFDGHCRYSANEWMGG